MKRKVFVVKVEIDVQAVTCPGVSLPSYGDVALKATTLHASSMTLKVPPLYPLLFHQKLVFMERQENASSLVELQEQLNSEPVHMQLIQWRPRRKRNSGCRGVVLAHFHCRLGQLLFPPLEKGMIPGITLDLLMAPTPHHKGVLVPKIEVSTRTTVEQTSGKLFHASGLVQHKTLSSSTLGHVASGLVQHKTLSSSSLGHVASAPDQVSRESLLKTRSSHMRRPTRRRSTATWTTMVDSQTSPRPQTPDVVLTPRPSTPPPPPPPITTSQGHCEVCNGYMTCFQGTETSPNTVHMEEHGRQETAEVRLAFSEMSRRQHLELLSPTKPAYHKAENEPRGKSTSYRKLFYEQLEKLYGELADNSRSRTANCY